MPDPIKKIRGDCQAGQEEAMQLEQDDLEIASAGLRQDLEGVLSWKWDDRFGALLAEFQVEKVTAIRAVLDSRFGHCWDRQSIRRAPGYLRNRVGVFGDLRGGQLLFTSDPAADRLLLVAAWWPWGDAMTISVRLAAVAAEAQPRRSGLLGKLAGLFRAKV